MLLLPPPPLLLLLLVVVVVVLLLLLPPPPLLLTPPLTPQEKDTLMSILPAYKAHVQRSGGSLLQYLSCHAMRLRWQWSGKVS